MQKNNKKIFVLFVFPYSLEIPCIVTVHLANVADHFHTLLDQELFLPESWSKKQGRKRRKPRLVQGESKPIEVRNMLKFSPVLRDQLWVKYYVNDNETGPVIGDVKEYKIYIRTKSEGEALAKPFRLIVARNVLVWVRE